jgi:hypothetical protein
MMASPSQTAAVRKLLDHQEISDRLNIWCRSVDTRDLTTLSEVFDPHLIWDFGRGTVDTSLGQVIKRIKAHMFGASRCGARHIHVSNLRANISGDDAESDAYFFAISAGKGEYLGRTLLEWGNYHDIWRRGKNGWRIIRRDYRVDVQDGPLEILYASAPAEMWKEGDARRLDHQ